MAPPTHARPGLVPALLLFALLAPLFVGIALLSYRPALAGPYVSDDWEVVRANPYVHDLSAANLRAIADPRGAPAFLSMNYAPVHLLAHGLAWQAFGAEPLGHHVVNVVLHGVVSALLAALLFASGASRLVASIAGLLFLVHPANVEAVAWIVQLKTLLAAAFSFAALLVLPTLPLLATLAFAAALLSKATALFALPVAAVFAFVRRERRLAPWLAVWAVLAIGYAVAELPIFRATAEVELAPLEPAERLRQGFALAQRYLLMAGTGIGVSAFQEPSPPQTWWDARWLAGLAAVSLLALWAGSRLRARSAAAVWWVWALAAFLPVSQAFSFVHPFADRYLYFILPGLLGGVALALPAAGRLRPIAGVAVLAVALFFGLWSSERARLWADEEALRLDAAANHPEGSNGLLLRAQRAVARGDRDDAIRALERVRDLDKTSFLFVVNDPRLAPLESDPRFQAIASDLAGRTIARLHRHEPPNQLQQRTLALAHVVRGEYGAAERAFARARALGGPLDAVVEQEHDALVELFGNARTPVTY